MIELQKPEQRQVHLGVFQLGCTNVDVYLMYGEVGGFFYTKPDNESMPRIKIGMDYENDEWWRVVNVIMHECIEYLLCVQLCVRFCPVGEFGNNAAEYLFVFDHQKFTEALARAAHFITTVLPLIAEKFNAQFDNPITYDI